MTAHREVPLAIDTEGEKKERPCARRVLVPEAVTTGLLLASSKHDLFVMLYSVVRIELSDTSGDVPLDWGD